MPIYFSNATDRALIMAFAIPFNMLASKYFFRIGSHFFPEIFFAIFAVALYFTRGKVRAIFLDAIKSKKFLILVFFAGFFAILGALRHDTEIFQSYARLRSLICLAFGISLASTVRRKHGGQATLEFFLIFLFSAMILFAIGALLKLQDDEGSKVPIPFFILPILVQILLLRGKYALGLLTAFIVSGIAALSFVRQNYGYAALSLLLFLYFFSTNFIKIQLSRMNISVSMNKNAALALLLFIVTIPLLPEIGGKIWEIMNSSESRYIQGVSKLNELQSYIAGTGTMGRSESLRVEGINYFFEQFEYYILPNGIINDSNFVTWSIWGGDEYYAFNVSLIRDSLLAYSVVTFGWLVFFIMLVSGLWAAISSFSTEEKPLRSTRLLAILLFFPTLFLDGTAATQLEKSIFLGILIYFAFFPGEKLKIPPSPAPLKPS